MFVTRSFRREQSRKAYLAENWSIINQNQPQISWTLSKFNESFFAILFYSDLWKFLFWVDDQTWDRCLMTVHYPLDIPVLHCRHRPDMQGNLFSGSLVKFLTSPSALSRRGNIHNGNVDSFNSTDITSPDTAGRLCWANIAGLYTKQITGMIPIAAGLIANKTWPMVDWLFVSKEMWVCRTHTFQTLCQRQKSTFPAHEIINNKW